MSSVEIENPDAITDQTLAQLTLLLKTVRENAADLKIASIGDLLDQACVEISNVREFIDRPEGILGSPATKHGEVAETIEIGVRNAWSVFNSVAKGADLHPDRFGPVDYIINGEEFQSKFHNGVGSTLTKGVKAHLDTYPEFSGQGGFYAIPKDQYETISKVLRGEGVELGSKSVNAIKKHVAEIEQSTGRSFDDLVRPASFTYKEVQLGKVDKTLDTKQEELVQEHDRRVEDIRDQHAPSLREGLRVVGLAAAAGAGVAFVRTAFSKYQDGRNIFNGELTADDWRDIGIDTASGAVLGGVSGGTLYLLTNCAKMSAPFAGALVSAVKGLAPLVNGYRTGAMSIEQLIDTGCMVCAEVGMVGAVTAIGQTAIPIPIVGALVGSVAGQVLASVLGKQVQGVEAAIEARMAISRAALSSKQQVELDALRRRFDQLGDLTLAAFNVDLNAAILDASVQLALTYGVDESKLLRTVDDVDRFFLN